ncbi:Wall-associated receptor kinase-like 20 [Linum grandiflorum]
MLESTSTIYFIPPFISHPLFTPIIHQIPSHSTNKIKATMKNTPNPLFLLCVFLISPCNSQKLCPNCGHTKIPYPLSTNPNCGDPTYALRCHNNLNLYLDALNGTSYLVLRIDPTTQRFVVQPSPFAPGKTCVSKDMTVSEGLRLNQTLPFNVTSSNTVFLFNCSPRLLNSPLNCTPSSLCHLYLEKSGRVDKDEAAKCANILDPCCTFVAGGMPSAYRIRLHSSGCKAFRSVVNIYPDRNPEEWEDGLEIQWADPVEPVCKTQSDCSSGSSKCLPDSDSSQLRCLCNKGYHWDHVNGTCKRKDNKHYKLLLKLCLIAIPFVSVAVIIAATLVYKSSRERAKLAKARQNMFLRSTSGAGGGDNRRARMFQLKEVKRATNNFSKFLGSGGFGEVYKGELQDGTLVAVKLAKVGNIKSTQQVLNEVGILSQVNHKNLVRLLGCCIESEQPLMVYEYISNGTLHDHLHQLVQSTGFLDWKTRLRISLHTAEALAYLHFGAHTPIYHRDVKSTNILLDGQFNAKVSDFGLSRLAKPGLSHVSTCAQGTLGYLDPEYYRNYQLNDKSDVYSFGVVLLELLTSRKAIDFSRDQEDINLAVFVIRRGNVDEVVDRQLLGDHGNDVGMCDVVRGSMEMFLKVAMGCLQEKKVDRPSMKEVVQELERIFEMVDGRKGCGNSEVGIHGRF